MMEHKNQTLPDLQIYVQNHYKAYNIPEMSIDRIKKICILNSFGSFTSSKLKTTNSLFGLKSFINHNNKANIDTSFSDEYLSVYYASRNI